MAQFIAAPVVGLSAVPRRPLAGVLLLRRPSATRIIVVASGSKKGPTPYQGPNRMFGKFRCPTCKRTWQSGNSWANTGQMCKRCDILVYPHSQVPLEPKVWDWDDDSERSGPHPAELCEMCQKLGYPCTRKRVWAPDMDDESDSDNDDDLLGDTLGDTLGDYRRAFAMAAAKLWPAGSDKVDELMRGLYRILFPSSSK